MSRSETLKQALEDLRSDKAIERQQGLKSVRATFDRDSVVLRFDAKGDGLAWLTLFQALFEAFTKELKACVSKTGTFPTQTTGRGTTSVRRLGDVASLIRWLTERSIERLNTRVLKSLLTHLIHAIIYRGELLSPVALDYAKTIKAIVTYAPHLHALKDVMWHELVALAFNIVLGRAPKRTLTEDLDPEVDSMDVDVDMSSGEAQSSTESDRAYASPSTSRLKRPFQDSPPKPSPSRRRRPSPVPKSTQPVSLEQIEFMSILATLLRFSSAPILTNLDENSNDDPVPSAFPRLLLSYFSRFLRIYAGDTSLHQDYLVALSATLSHLTINCRHAVRSFAYDCWHPLVAMWGRKDRSMKENLVVVLRYLFPLLTAEPLDDDTSADPADAVAVLWAALDVGKSQSQSRWGAHTLSLDALQLRLLTSDDTDASRGAFVADTFRYGWHFDEEHALSWAILQLQADCAEKLYLRSESTYSSITSSRKRLRFENPIASLLSSIKSQATQQVRTHYLQVILFFIDRHWNILHEQLRRDTIAALVPLVSFEDPSIQSWTFLCLAAIAHAECSLLSGSSETSLTNTTSLWDSVWMHVMRRANVPAVSRAACHAAHILLIHSKRLLSPQRVLLEIESFAKDLDVQGPAYPYDSVCDFIVLCLRIANQDVRLYRMQMEEKVLSWLMESWRLSNDRRMSMPLHTVADIHALLDGITGSSKRVGLRCGIMLPLCAIVDAMVEETTTKVIRDFQLHSRLPPFRLRRTTGEFRSPVVVAPDDGAVRGTFSYGDTTDLAPPRGRERRISAFLLKYLEETSLALGNQEDNHVFPTAETIRCFLDLAVTALCFEASLLLNGTQSNRRVLQAACKLLGATIPLLADSRWKAEERRLILDGLDPLTRSDDEDARKQEWVTLVTPGERTGIRTQVLKGLLAVSRFSQIDNSLRRDLQRFVFRSADVQDTFTALRDGLRNVLRLVVGKKPVDDKDTKAHADDEDGFGPMRTTHSTSTVSASRSAEKEIVYNRHVVDACITALAVVPILQSSSGEPTRDRQLTELVLESEADAFLTLGPAYCEQVGRRTLNLTTAILEGLLDNLKSICLPYVYKNNDEARLLVVQILEATSHLWLQPSVASDAPGQQARYYCWWIVKLLKNLRSWRVSDAIIRFLDGYLTKDPKQDIWTMPIDDEDDVPDSEDLPAAILPTFGKDQDIRIRLRVAAASPRLLSAGRLAGRRLMEDVYHEVRTNLSSEQNDYESILTRLLCLGNMLIADAAVRRGAYWHLIELAYYSATYHSHLKAVLTGVVERMGIGTLAELFSCYSSQFAYSLRRGGINIFMYPPDLLGYRDRRECAEATFHAFTPTNLLAQGNVEEIRNGKELFTRHCQAIQKTEEAGMEECFAELISYGIVFLLSHYAGEDEAELARTLRTKVGHIKSDAAFLERLGQNADGIVIGILKSLGDQDVSPNGHILKALEDVGSEGVLDTFRAITRYRPLDTYETHAPNLPFYSTAIVLRGIEWCCRLIKSADSPAVTYHVLQQLFADIESSPLVNEQYRLLNAVCLWIACHHDHLKDEALLRTLTRRAVTMLAQVDLAHGAQSLLEWCFSLYKASSIKADYRLADVLIRVSSIAHDFSQSVEDTFIAQLGADLLAWAEKQADSLRRNKRLSKQVARSLAAWPRELPPSLQSACDGVELSELASVLTDHGVSASKFRLVRRIHELARQSDTGEEFSTSNFWRLKACIPPEKYLVDSDIDAFTSLLMLNRGRVDSIGSDQFSSRTLRAVHRRATEGRTGRHKDYPPRVDVHVARAGIVEALLTMLDTSPAHQVHVAYRTLRTLVSVSSPEPYIGSACPADIRREVELLEAFSQPFVKEPALEMNAVLAGEAMVHLAKDFHSWIPRITILLCQALGDHDPFFSPLAPILQSDHQFAEEVLPVLVQCLLQMEYDRSASDIAGSVRHVLSQYFTVVLSYDDAAIACYRAIINVVLHLRSFHPSSEPKDALAHDKWLSVDFTLLSRCAIKCNAYTTALLFLELASEYGKQNNASGASLTDSEGILFEIYSHIDEPDGFYGIQTDDLRNFFVKRLRHEKQWDKAFRFHGAAVESGGAVPSDTDGIVQALSAFGFNQLALNTMQNLSSESNATGESSTLAYNLGWRAETWDLPESLGNDHSGAALYLALRAVYRERSPHAVDAILRRAFIQEMNRLRDLGNENFTEIRQVTQNLMCLSQVRQWRGDERQRELQSRHINMVDWNQFTTLDSAFEFGNIEAIMATRVSLVRSLRQKEQRDQIGELASPFCDALVSLEKACLLCLSERARDLHQVQIALNSVIRAQNLERRSSSEVAQEFASVLWLMKEPKLAIKSLGTLTSLVRQVDSKEVEHRVEYATLLARLGSWSAEASMMKPSQIIAECFGPAAELIMSCDQEELSKLSSDHSHATVLHQYAIFAERQYHAVSKSPDALRWKFYVDRKREEIKQRDHQLRRIQTNTPQYHTMKQEQNRADALLKQDIQRSKDHFGQLTTFLALAIEMYSRCLAASDKYDEDSPIRLCSLWLANFDNDDPSLRFANALDLVPSRKFVFLAHQLTARLSKSENGSSSRNQETLQRVIQRMGRDHPFHALFPLYCIRIDRTSSQASTLSRRQSNRHDSPAPSQVERVAAVGDMFDKLRSDPAAGERVAAVENVCDVSLEWAKHPIKHQYYKKPTPREPIPIPDHLGIRRLKSVQIPVITAGTPVDPTCAYQDCVWISHYDTHFTVAGGVNLPKIVKCFGSNGTPYKQLFKGEGEDDLRQDAVMEQVFDLVNVVLRHDRETQKRKLTVRGYKVIPLATQAGVMEFVDNTTPLAGWLRPAHARYHPNNTEGEQALKSFLDQKKLEWREKPQEIINRFVRVREKAPPVMRHYFTEKHKTPMTWFAMRLHYARSVATTSIVGHILGLGDRHTSNILMDNKTGEVVHIDLGIAFEQGKLLPQPERVPFRLTADMIDGLGISGTQGVFQRCAEETLRVLRDGSETILTVLEVFKYDPLHSWTASEFKIKRAQGGQTGETAQLTGEAFRFAIGIDMASGVTDEAADRALSTVARKLDKTLSVEYTVNELITEASDPANLALMYTGWAPHY